MESRLKARREIWHRLAIPEEREKEAAQPAPFVTISRQYGCMAYVLADRLAQRLNAEFSEWNFTIYGREALEVMVQHEAIAADVVDSLSERTRGIIEDWVGQLTAEEQVDIIVRLVQKKHSAV